MGVYDFKPVVVDEITKKAMFFCSNPQCLCFTSYSNSEGKARKIAEAAHVLPSGINGPRAGKANQYPKVERNSSENGIWLCVSCHDQIDADPDAYSPSKLFRWKKNQEALIRSIVGKDLEAAILSLINSKHYHQATHDFLSALEGRRMLYEALDHEFPSRVLESVEIIRYRINDVRAKVENDSMLANNVNFLQSKIDDFLRELSGINLKTLQCNSNNPDWVKFSNNLYVLRQKMMVSIRILAMHSGYETKFLN
jgi:hypothetical protein